jgi:hypothetical protein
MSTALRQGETSYYSVHVKLTGDMDTYCIKERVLKLCMVIYLYLKVRFKFLNKKVVPMRKIRFFLNLTLT